MTDTIIALATPEGESALGLLRISGPLSSMLVASALNTPCPIHKNATLTSYRSIDGETLDQVVFCFFEEGKSFTGEETIEITSHGNLLIIKSIIDDLICRGCRAAEPGEFTRRAFLNGKIDLTQAESVAELISAKSEIEIKHAQKNLKGFLSSKIQEIQNKLIRQQANLEAEIDFPEDEIDEVKTSSLITQISQAQGDIEKILEYKNRSQTLKEGINVLLLGPPNAGKSTLFNAILGMNRALVSNEPGTTRDYITRTIRVENFSLELTDSAGIRNVNNAIEEQGVRKTIELIDVSEVILLVLDGSLPYPADFNDIITNKVNNKKVIIVENKSDLEKVIEKLNYPENEGIIEVSATNNSGLESLLSLVNTILSKIMGESPESFVLINSRHTLALKSASECLTSIHDLINDEADNLLVLQEMKETIAHLGNIIGTTSNDDMLDILFSEFCIGK